MARRLTHRPTSRVGVTLIELVVVLAIMGMTLVVMAPAVRSAFGVNERQAAQRMSAMLRYAYDEAVVRNAPMRVAYDLDNRRYWIEAADGPVRIFRNRQEREAFDEFLAE
jgi:Tfp pilus assembly protein FimT